MSIQQRWHVAVLSEHLSEGVGEDMPHSGRNRVAIKQDVFSGSCYLHFPVRDSQWALNTF